MSRSRSLFVASALVLGSGCSCNDRPARPEAPLHPIRAATEPLDPALYDAQGRLLVSGHELGHLAIPVGLQRGTTVGGSQVFEGVVPIRAVQAFFRAHLVSGEIVQSGDALRFVAARPVTATGIANEHYDIVIMPSGQGAVRVRITPRIYETRTRSEEETRRAIGDAWNRQD